MDAFFSESLYRVTARTAQRIRPAKKKKIPTCPHLINTVPIVVIVFVLETNLIMLASGVLQHLAQFNGLRPDKTQPWLHSVLREPIASLSSVVVVQFFCVVFFVSWVLAVRTPPGSPDESWRGNADDCRERLDTCREYRHAVFAIIEKDMNKMCLEANPQYAPRLRAWLKAHPQQVLAVAQTIKHRWCKHCRSWKPDRTHHSRRLNRCVLRMDHVCPWVNNVVGFRNYKYFFLMLFYAIVLLFAYAVSASLLLVHIAQIKQKYTVHLPFLHMPVGGSWDFWVTQVVLILFSVGLIVPLGFYWVFHCNLVVAGLTSIEKKERTHASHDRRMGCSKLRDNELYVPSPWDHGFLRNVNAMLGGCFLFWPIPTTIGLGLDKPGAGTAFPVRRRHPMRDHNWDIAHIGKKKA